MAKNTTHHRVGPSALDALAKCCRFRYLEHEDEDAANEGTLLHEAFEKRILRGLDEEQTRCVQSIIDLVESYKSTEGGEDQWIEMREQKVSLRDLTYGTLDCALVHKTLPIIYVIDAKFTRRHSPHSMQLRTYSSALIEKLLAEGRAVDKVITVVAAPRIGEPEVEEHDAMVLLASVRQWITDLYERIDDPFNPPTPDSDLCEKCARASKCPALCQVVRQAGIQMGLPLPSVFSPDSLISDRDRAIGQVLAGALANWAEQVKKSNAEYVALSGNTEQIAGFKLVSRSTGLRVGSEFTPIAISALMANLSVSQDVLLEHCTLALGKLGKTLAEQTGRPEADIKEEIKEALGDIAQEGKAQYLQKTKRVTDEAMLLGM